ncbi:MAG TPA: BrnA antitoxin family protein [Terriglobales bacterium]|nr:BrnA antitoxin family protein [Terriglobales bacterium]
MGKIVRSTLADVKLTPKLKRELQKLAAMPDHTIDLSDIPEATEKFWKNAVRNPWYRPRKQQVTLRIDADVLAWLRRGGKGYQSRLNSLLRTAMLEQLRGKNELRGKKKSA